MDRGRHNPTHSVGVLFHVHGFASRINVLLCLSIDVMLREGL